MFASDDFSSRRGKIHFFKVAWKMWFNRGLRHFYSKRYVCGFVVVSIAIVFFVYGMIQTNNLRIQPKTENNQPSEHEHSDQYLNNHKDSENEREQSKTKTKEVLESVTVDVNHKQSFQGLLINRDVYVPFEFLKTYYEVGGEYVTDAQSLSADAKKFFFWSHTKQVIDTEKLPFKSYSTSGVYMNFNQVNVEKRARVKCISGLYEVPVTTQWDLNGYFYPIQIAQYGLAHLSRYYSEPKTTNQEMPLKIPDGSTGLFKSKVSNAENFILKVSFKNELSSFEVRVLASDKYKYVLRYSLENTLIKRQRRTITHGIGEKVMRPTLTRNLNVDLMKGVSFVEGKKSGVTKDVQVVKVLSISFHQSEHVKEASFLEVDHVTYFLAAANWFLEFQDEMGGWKTNVSRTVMKGMKSDPGWYSAMAQGQAISLLCRVYQDTKNVKYLNAALKATKLFNVPSSENGIVAKLFGKYPWYEEYPVTPSLFVLNGFLYSLLGLYDLSKTASLEDGKEAEHLFSQGVSSLESMLPLFDSGHGSFYDLRHLTVPGTAPNIARWQYHRVHLELLYIVQKITKSVHISKTLKRWVGYASGIIARHN